MKKTEYTPEEIKFAFDSFIKKCDDMICSYYEHEFMVVYTGGSSRDMKTSTVAVGQHGGLFVSPMERSLWPHHGAGPTPRASLLSEVMLLIRTMVWIMLAPTV